MFCAYDSNFPCGVKIFGHNQPRSDVTTVDENDLFRITLVEHGTLCGQAISPEDDYSLQTSYTPVANSADKYEIHNIGSIVAALKDKPIAYFEGKTEGETNLNCKWGWWRFSFNLSSINIL